MRMRLRITRTGERPEDRELTGESLTVGRAPSSHLSIPDDRSQLVSWQHCRIDADQQNAWLHDLRSTNGTYLNGRKVEQPERLRPGDVIRFGQTGPTLEVLHFELTQTPTSPPAYTPATINLPPTGASSVRNPEPLAPAVRGVPVRQTPSRSAANIPNSPNNHSPQMSATRALLVGMQKKQKKWATLAIVCLLVAGSAIGYVLWIQHGRIGSLEDQVARINESLDLDTDPDTVDTAERSIGSATQDGYARVAQLDKEIKSSDGKDGKNAEVLYKRAVLSTAWVLTDRGEGTGTLIDHQGKKLIVTAYHVVHQAKSQGVIFPKFHNGKILASRTHYVHNGTTAGKDTISCRVWASDPKLDLAILEPTGLPDYVPSLKVCEKQATQAEIVHTIGGSPVGTSGLWSYTQSNVRQIAPGNMNFSNGQKINATLVETANEVTNGDSGGPLFNKNAELVGVTSGGSDGTAAIAKFIDASHVRDVLTRRPTEQLHQPKPPAELKKNPLPPVPNKPTHVYILLAIDDTDTKSNEGRGISAGMRVNLRHMTEWIENGLPKNAYTLRVLQGTEASGANIHRYYNELRGRVTPNDTLMFYYAGHGACDKPTQAHYLCMQGGGWMGRSDDVHRAKLLNTMRSVGGKLHVLLSDCCSSYYGQGLGPGTSSFASGNKYLVPLLLNHRGVVDWQAASPSEYGWSNSQIGGFFTRNLKECCMSGKYTSWDALYSEARARTVRDTAAFCPSHPMAIKNNQKQQTPYRFPGSDNVRRD